MKPTVADKCLSTIATIKQDMATSPIAQHCSSGSSEIETSTEISTSTINTSTDEYMISEVNSSSSYADEELEKKRNEEYYKVTLEHVTKEPKLLIGIVPEFFFNYFYFFYKINNNQIPEFKFIIIINITNKLFDID